MSIPTGLVMISQSLWDPKCLGPTTFRGSCFLSDLHPSCHICNLSPYFSIGLPKLCGEDFMTVCPKVSHCVYIVWLWIYLFSIYTAVGSFSNGHWAGIYFWVNHNNFRIYFMAMFFTRTIVFDFAQDLRTILAPILGHITNDGDIFYLMKWALNIIQYLLANPTALCQSIFR